MCQNYLKVLEFTTLKFQSNKEYPDKTVPGSQPRVFREVKFCNVFRISEENFGHFFFFIISLLIYIQTFLSSQNRAKTASSGRLFLPSGPDFPMILKIFHISVATGIY